MDVSKLDDYVVNVLKKSGWYPGRKFNPDRWISIMSEEGYEIHPYAHDILVELGDLSIREKMTDTHRGATLNFDAFDAGSGEFGRLEEFERASNDKLYPIGMYRQFFVYAGTSKRIYAGGALMLYVVGESIEDYLNSSFKMIYEPIRLI